MSACIFVPNMNGEWICTGPGRTIDRVTKAALCRCGQSSNKSFCDGSHTRVGFKAKS
jgi:CDGSH-type Zn-finger protein